MSAIAAAMGWAIAVVAVAGVLLSNARRRECFYLWLFSNGASAAVHAYAGMSGLLVRDTVFFALAIHGLWAWSKAGKEATR